eukprot:6093676-Pyramimonas_sp.AAC.1
MVAEGIASLALPEDSNRTVRLADFGCADGGPEMPLVHKIKSMLPKDCALAVSYTHLTLPTILLV